MEQLFPRFTSLKRWGWVAFIGFTKGSGTCSLQSGVSRAQPSASDSNTTESLFSLSKLTAVARLTSPQRVGTDFLKVGLQKMDCLRSEEGSMVWQTESVTVVAGGRYDLTSERVARSEGQCTTERSMGTSLTTFSMISCSTISVRVMVSGSSTYSVMYSTVMQSVTVFSTLRTPFRFTVSYSVTHTSLLTTSFRSYGSISTTVFSYGTYSRFDSTGGTPCCTAGIVIVGRVHRPQAGPSIRAFAAISIKLLLSVQASSKTQLCLSLGFAGIKFWTRLVSSLMKLYSQPVRYSLNQYSKGASPILIDLASLIISLPNNSQTSRIASFLTLVCRASWLAFPAPISLIALFISSSFTSSTGKSGISLKYLKIDCFFLVSLFQALRLAIVLRNEEMAFCNLSVFKIRGFAPPTSFLRSQRDYSLSQGQLILRNQQVAWSVNSTLLLLRKCMQSLSAVVWSASGLLSGPIIGRQ